MQMILACMQKFAPSLMTMSLKTFIPISFAVKSAALKEALDDLEWTGSSTVSPILPMVTFRGEDHGDLRIEFPYDRQRELFIALNCHHDISHRYTYKSLKATTQIPGSILKDI